MMRPLWGLPILLLVTASCAGGGLGVPSVPVEIADMFLPAEQEEQLGARIDQELRQQMRFVEDPRIQRYVEQVGARVAAASADERGPLKVQFAVVDDPRANAFATAGGNIYVTTGLLQTLRGEDELAAVLAHEVAHVTNRDVARALVAQYGLSTLAASALGQQPGIAAQLATQVAGAGVLAAHTRDQERVADITAIDYLLHGGYDPVALIRLFDTLERAGESQPGLVQAFFSTHPSEADRKRAIAAEIQRRGIRQARAR